MSIFGLVILGLLMGIVFGIALEKSRVFEPGMIIGQMQLSNFIMLNVFLSATVFGLLILAVLNGAFGGGLSPKSTQVLANIIGGLLLGTGFAIAGSCPGTVFAQVGAGYSDAWLILGGGLAGTLFYGYTKTSVADKIIAVGNHGKLSLDKVTGLPFWAVAVVFAVVFAVIFALVLFWLEKRYPTQGELGSKLDGVK